MATVVSYTARTRRTTQALLLLFALAVGLGTFVVVGLGRSGTVPTHLPVVAATTIAIAVVLQIIVSWRAPYADPLILPTALLINLVGIAIIFSIDLAKAKKGVEGFAYGSRQLLWTGLGAALAVGVLLVLRDHRVLRRYTWISAVVGVVFLLMPLAPLLGTSINGSRVWIHIGPFSFQPAEIAKLCFAVFFAGYLVARRDTLALAGPKVLGIHLPRWSDFGPILAAWAVAVAVLVFETDLGTSLLFFGLFVVMLYVATDRPSWMIIGAAMFLPPAIVAVTQVSHVRKRMTCWLDSMASANFQDCYQINQGAYGLANGGVVGAGLGQGRPTMVPFAHSDFIYTSLAEQMGLIGAVGVLLLYLILVQRALRIAVGVSDGFGTLLATGLGFVMALQVFVVVGGITRVIPLTGLTLPFLAAGGSSLVANWIIVGLLLRLSDAARRPAARPAKTPAEVAA